MLKEKMHFDGYHLSYRADNIHYAANTGYESIGHIQLQKSFEFFLAYLSGLAR